MVPDRNRTAWSRPYWLRIGVISSIAIVAAFLPQLGSLALPVAMPGAIPAAASRVISLNGTTIAATSGTPFSGQVATFSVPDTAATAAQFAATISWGDGTASSDGQVTGPTGGPFSVSGSHTYANTGSFTTSITVVDLTSPPPSGNYQVVATTINGPNLSGTGSNPLGFATATASCPANSVLVSGGGVVEPAATDVSVHLEGSFPSDANGHPLTANGAAHSWTAISEDGLGVAGNVTTSWALCATGGPSASQVILDQVQGPNGAGSTQPRPTGTGYATATASCPSGTTLTGGGAETIPGNLGVASGQPSPLHMNGSFPSDASANQLPNGSSPTSWTGAFEEGADVNGTPTQTVTTAFAVCSTTTMSSQVQEVTIPGPFGAQGAPQNQVTTTASCPAGSVLFGGGGFTQPPSDSSQPSPLHLVGTFPSSSDGSLGPNGANNPSFWTASAREGNDVDAPGTTETVTSVFTLCSGTGNQATATGTADVSAAGNSLVVTGTAFTATAGTAFSGTVATFSGGPSGANAASFTAVINWGDGTPTSTGTVAAAGSHFTVSGTHTYASAGTDTTSIQVCANATCSTGSGTATVSAAASGPATISGTITQAGSGTPLPGICAYLYTAAGTRTSDPGTCSSAAGTYTVTVANPSGSYTLAFFDPTAQHATQWWNNKTTQASATTFTLTPGQAMTADAAMASVTAIAGTVTDATGAPVSGVCVYLYTTGGTRTSDVGTCTGASGTYVMNVAAPGSYTVGFYDPSARYLTQWANGQATQGTANPVTVTSGAVTSGVNAQLHMVTTITGTVTDHASGSPISGVCVYLYAAGGSRTADPGVCTGADGTYRLPVAAAGSYNVAFLDPTAAHATQWYNGAATQAGATAVSVTANQSTPNINASMTP